MFDRHFLTSKLGIAALVSVVMMVTFALSAPTLAQVAGSPAEPSPSSVMGLPMVVLA
ncbi:hypothetical protein [Tsuneonella sp. HG222]